MDTVTMVRDLNDIYTRTDTILKMWRQFVPVYWIPYQKIRLLRNRCLAALQSGSTTEYRRVWNTCKPEWDVLWNSLRDKDL